MGAPYRMAQNGTNNGYIDWDAVRWEYENCKEIELDGVKVKPSFRNLAKKYKTNHMAISRRAKVENWQKYDPVAVVKKANSAQRTELKAVAGHYQLLDSVGARKIKEIIKELGADNYSHIDEPLIVMYALQYQRLLKLEALVQVENETIISSKGLPYLNPNFNALQSVSNSLAKLGDRLGISVASRKRIGIKLGKKEDKVKSLFDSIKDFAAKDSDLEDI